MNDTRKVPNWVVTLNYDTPIDRFFDREEDARALYDRAQWEKGWGKSLWERRGDVFVLVERLG